MRKKPASPKDSADAPLTERRAALQGKAGASPLKQLKGALGRPMKVEWRNGQPHVAMVERRRTPLLDRAQAHLCAELGALLLTQQADETSNLLRPLVMVHDTLQRRGWEGVGALPPHLLAKAARQSAMLASEDPSPVLKELGERLRTLHAVAVARDAASSQADSGVEEKDDDDGNTTVPHHVEVSEGSFDDFERLERNWTRTVPSDLAPLDAER
jgi:hypothetical protein